VNEMEDPPQLGGPGKQGPADLGDSTKSYIIIVRNDFWYES
jgi:hypothetical protein